MQLILRESAALRAERRDGDSAVREMKNLPGERSKFEDGFTSYGFFDFSKKRRGGMIYFHMKRDFA